MKPIRTYLQSTAQSRATQAKFDRCGLCETLEWDEMSVSIIGNRFIAFLVPMIVRPGGIEMDPAIQTPTVCARNPSKLQPTKR